MMMMMIIPISLVRQNEGAQGEKEEQAGDRRKGGPTGTPTPGADAFIGQVGQRCRERGTGENMDGRVGFCSTGGTERARN